MGSVVTVTTAAREYLVGLRTRANLPSQEMALRVVRSPQGQLGLLPDLPRADDHVVEHEGTTALLVGRESARPLTGAVIDTARTRDGVRLVLRRPPAPRRTRPDHDR